MDSRDEIAFRLGASLLSKDRVTLREVRRLVADARVMVARRRLQAKLRLLVGNGNVSVRDRAMIRKVLDEFDELEGAVS